MCDFCNFNFLNMYRIKNMFDIYFYNYDVLNLRYRMSRIS